MRSFSISSIRGSFRRSSSPSSINSNTSTSRDSYTSQSSTSPVDTINSIMHRQPSMQDLEEEKRSFGSGLEIMEPRPIVYWGGMVERLVRF